jgi:glycosyltransferase involved in cell wall biosynthesis
MLKHFAEARVYIGISLSDGISTSLLEAMATGCYPIQTNTSCAREWLVEYSGSIVSPHNPALLSQLLVQILPNKELLDTAAISNVSLINLIGTSEIIERQAKLFYNFR